MVISILAASALFISYLITSNMVSAMLAAVFTIAMCAIALVFSKRKKELMQSLLVFIVLALALYAHYTVSINMAFSRGERFAAACEQYRTRVGQYPKELSEVLAEAKLADIRAKYTLFWCGFHYVNNQIYFVPDPTMPVPAYDLVAKKWTAISLFRDVKKQGV